MNTKRLEAVLSTFASNVVQEAKNNLKSDVNKYGQNKAGGDLYNTMTYNVQTEKDFFLIDFLMEPYGKFVDKGVQGKTSTYPASALSDFRYGSGTGPKGGLKKGVTEWLNKKKFQWRTELGRFMSYETMSWLIARSIYNKGIKANHFFTKPFDQLLEDLPKEMVEGFFLDVEDAIILGTKK
jgi:hypothetical protein